jgi:hypothetical protein
MAGPLNGISPQIPFATTFQPGQNNQVRTDAQKPRQDFIQTRGAAASDSQKSETRDQNTLRAAPRQSSNEQRSGNNQRGSLLDVTV